MNQVHSEHCTKTAHAIFIVSEGQLSVGLLGSWTPTKISNPTVERVGLDVSNPREIKPWLFFRFIPRFPFLLHPSLPLLTCVDLKIILPRKLELG